MPTRSGTSPATGTTDQHLAEKPAPARSSSCPQQRNDGHRALQAEIRHGFDSPTFYAASGPTLRRQTSSVAPRKVQRLAMDHAPLTSSHGVKLISFRITWTEGLPYGIFSYSFDTYAIWRQTIQQTGQTNTADCRHRNHPKINQAGCRICSGNQTKESPK